ncbi:hypothetical protein SDC9_180417 [bioreactor metagenome]|uniref:Uncharacterized protein n=1 Tax=bioreactor metagenome TaxID=1076179 RepID=A0A645H9R7_9ZZZZ
MARPPEPQVLVLEFAPIIVQVQRAGDRIGRFRHFSGLDQHPGQPFVVVQQDRFQLQRRPHRHGVALRPGTSGTGILLRGGGEVYAAQRPAGQLQPLDAAVVKAPDRFAVVHGGVGFHRIPLDVSFCSHCMLVIFRTAIIINKKNHFGNAGSWNFCSQDRGKMFEGGGGQWPM